MKKFEYKMLTISVAHLNRSTFRAELDQKFQDYGNEGWELIKLESIVEGGILTQGGSTKELFAVFKREKE